MNESRIELKVGFFVAVGLALLMLLVLSFSRGLTLFRHTDNLSIRFENAAGLKPTADVMMAGVTIGKVTTLQLSPDALFVNAHINILSEYKIRSNAVFQIDALGFLGDQYISVIPSSNLDAGFLRDGDSVQGQSPFNMQQAVHSVSGLLDQVKTTIIDVHKAVSNLNQTVLSEQSLSNITLALSHMEAMALTVRQMAQGAEDLIHSNSPPINAAVTNLVTFSEKLNFMTADLDRLIATNRPVVDETMQNLRDTSASFKQVAADLQAGKGLAGGLLHDEEMKATAAALMSNASAMSATFATFGSNLNQRGIWSMMWKPKHTERSEKSLPPAP